jgi:hypothetical protein
MKRALFVVGLVLVGLGLGFLAALLWPRSGVRAEVRRSG